MTAAADAKLAPFQLLEENDARATDPRGNSSDAVIPPVSTISPGERTMPLVSRWRISHTTAVSGFPITSRE